MAVKNTGLNVSGLRSTFFERFDARQNAAYYLRLATMIKSEKDEETYKWLGSIPPMKEWGDGRLAKGLRTESFSVANMKYEATIEVDRDEISDDQTGQIRLRIQDLADRAASHKDGLIGDLLKNGESAGFNSYDGVSFFNTAHASGASGNQSNKLDFDISVVMPAEPNTPDAPSVPTARRAFSEATATMATYKDDQGLPLRLRPSGLVVACAPVQVQTFLDALNATMVNNTSVQAVGGAGVDVIGFPELTDLSKFYVLKTDDTIRPFIFQDREPIEFDAQEQGSDEAFRREKYLYGVRARYRITYAQWQKAVRVDLI